MRASLVHFLLLLLLCMIAMNVIPCCQGLLSFPASAIISQEGMHRRHILQRAATAPISFLFFTTVTSARRVNAATHNNNNNNNARELDFCLVQTARAIAWAQHVAQPLRTTSAASEPKAAYLEARLGAKALLTGRMGGGANAAVYRVSTLQLTGCLNDLVTSYGANAPLVQTWREDIAAIVEFDGLDSVMDASPRSALTLQQYNDSKRKFVQRLLEERMIPTGQRLLQQFPERQARVQEYLQRYHSDELFMLTN